MARDKMYFFFSSRRRHTRYWRDWSSDVCSSDLAGRRPTDVRRLLNIGALGGEPRADLPPTPIQMLTSLALEHGFSTFVLASDDADELTRYGQEIAPAVRELVAAGRTQP